MAGIFKASLATTYFIDNSSDLQTSRLARPIADFWMFCFLGRFRNATVCLFRLLKHGILEWRAEIDCDGCNNNFPHAGR